MRSLFPRATWLLQASSLGRRVSALIFLAALSSGSQGCGIISDASNGPTSTRKGLTPDLRTSDPSTDPPHTDTIPREIPPIAVLPSDPEPEESATLAKIPELRHPTMVETGLASWYGPRFHGKRTASGEIFNQHDFTAAHRTLPWGSKVKVTNIANGKSVEVRINDRGPFGKGRIIDVSRAAARVLGLVGSGITTVRIEWLADSEKSNDLVLQDK
jgi:rare lipoprotein A